MNKSIKFATTLLIALCLTGGISIVRELNSPIAVTARTAEASVAKRVYARANPAVVTIRGKNGHGSGFIINGGYIVTNAHVVANQPEVMTVMMADGKTEIPADVVGFATGGVDLALLKINRPKQKFPTLQLAKSKSIEVGDSVYAIGTPLGEVNQNTFTSGMVSAFRDRGSIIQHNAAINQGNSGGPLLNDKGEVVGVNFAGAYSNVEDANGNVVAKGTGNVGVNYAIGVNIVRKFLADARKGKIAATATILTQ